MSVRPNLALFPHLTARANIAYPLEQRGHDKAEIENRLERLTEECGIDADTQRLLPAALSAEQQLRVALARAIGGEP
jgi:ABC-type sugar transport system ATPase subunit